MDLFESSRASYWRCHSVELQTPGLPEGQAEDFLSLSLPLSLPPSHPSLSLFSLGENSCCTGCSQPLTLQAQPSPSITFHHSGVCACVGVRACLSVSERMCVRVNVWLSEAQRNSRSFTTLQG